MSERRTTPIPASKSRHSLVIQLGIALATLVLIAATWIFTLVSMDTEEREARGRVEGSASNLALSVEWQLNRQLQSIDETMQNLAADWKADPIHFDPNAWRRRSGLLADISAQIFLLDTQGYVMAATRPDLMGLDMSQSDYFTAQRSGRAKGLFVGPAIHWKTTGRWEINLSRRLVSNDGAFAGVITVSYDPWALTNLLEQVDLGSRGLIALVGSDGAIRALVSPGEVRPGEDIGRSQMFQASMQRLQGTWTGPSSPDGVVRVHAFRRLRDQNLTIIVGIGRDEALRTATIWATNALLFAGGVSAAVLCLAALLIREVRAARGRELRLDRDRISIEQAYGALEAAKASAEAKTAQIEATLEGMSDGVMVLDNAFRLVQWNDRFPECTGVPTALLQVGQPMAALIRGQALAGEFGAVDVEAEVQRRIADLRASSGTLLVERPRPDGSTLELRRSMLPGGGMVTLYTDITARKRAADAQQAARRLAEEATEQKSRFVAIVSHEIRTPLNAVVNSLALLDETGLSVAQRHLADTARQAGDALMELINDILELSKMEAGHLALRPAEFDLRAMLRGVQSMFRTQAASRSIRLVVEVAPEVPERIRADGGRLRQVLMNFVSNATKFSMPGEATLRAAAVRMAGAPTLILAVADQGPRIPDAEMGQLFLPFSRLDNARASSTPGTGLGLAICARLARLMGGQIGLREAEGGGNEFWLTLPLEAVPVQPGLPSPNTVSLARRRRDRVLLVEDIPANHLVTATLLRREGHCVDIAESGAEAIQMMQVHPYDFVFMDLLMPGMNGYEATRRIRALPGPPRVVPIVALTANTTPEDRVRCLAAGMDDMLGKPVRPAEMFAMLRRRDWSRADVAPSPVPMVIPLAAARVSFEMGPQLDQERLADLRQGLPATTMTALVEQCLEDMGRRLPGLREALASSDCRQIEVSAHALAGMAATYGFAAIDRRMRYIIRAAQAQDPFEAAHGAVGLEADFAATQAAVRSHIEAMES